MIKIENFVLLERVIMPRWALVSLSLNWTYLNNADVFLKFGVLIRVRYIISFPKQS